LAVDGSNIATSEAAAVAQNVTFNNGQAAISVNYADVGQVTLGLKDVTTGNPDLPTGIRGASDAFVVKPAGFVLNNIQRSSDSFANPGTAVDETGAAFMAAGDLFSVTVTAVNSLGNATPNYGQESVPESVLLTPTLVAAGASNNPAIAFGTGFDGFVNGVDTGTDFHWDEVGIITLTPSVGDGDYLGGGDVSGTVSANVGRFYPDHFTTAVTAAGTFNNSCTVFTYLGQNFDYLSNPTVTATAMNAFNVATANYTGAWAKLTTGGVSLSYPTSDNTQLDSGGVNPIAVTATAGSLSRLDNGDGSLTFTLGGASPDSFVYDRSAGQVPPFTTDLTIQLTAVSDGEAAANDLSPAKDISPIGNLQRFGRGYAQDVHGTMSLIGDSLTVPLGVSYYDTGGSWTLNSDDSCSQYNYSKTDNGISTNASSASPVTLVNGVGDLTLTISADAGSTGGTSVIDSVWPSWLRYDIDGIDLPLDGNLYDDNPSATATFGIFRGDDRYLYWREAP
jgi:MSHA biogenesis protein MshQ